MSERYVAKITSKGQLTLPGPIRKNLGVGPGDQVAFEVGPEGVSVVPIRPSSPFAAWEGRWREGEGLTLEEINAWVRDLRGHGEEDL
jgi:AbrB family looped-hinge helix DNA binding protein